MLTPHPDNDLIDKDDLITQNVSCKNDKITNVSESNADVIEHEEDVCDKDCGGTKIRIGYSGDSYITVNWHRPKFDVCDGKAQMTWKLQ
ncbi:hypothetical protein HanXRQr2_Chr14g0646921 [Helianthus annuus]|uniref:Uncharacterized protein n=1 Tax=Helianthus annuus TaxID=4232 RepID=A0A9K3E9Q7_HELAN|nr:hypothetical protein HanXRQr2_Chr14g0646921 [Helianthus annuus]KAJ0840604.1 hypothetical protein HanPSC8_Chr14g0620671 [Helianthus annuus]